MMILDAINSAASEHAVYFLVTAYVESLQHLHSTLGLPEAVVKLPVGGVHDLEERLTALRHDIRLMPEVTVAASELSAVFASAVQRLGTGPSQTREKR
jgi:hypothetical protein